MKIKLKQVLGCVSDRMPIEIDQYQILEHLYNIGSLYHFVDCIGHLGVLIVEYDDTIMRPDKEYYIMFPTYNPKQKQIKLLNGINSIW